MDRMSRDTLILNATYQIDHTRKGRFTGSLISENEEWATFEIVEGVTGAMNDYNKRHPGDEVIVRKSFCKFEQVV